MWPVDRRRVRPGRRIQLWLAAASLLGGCGLRERAAEDSNAAFSFSSRSLAEVVLDTSLQLTERRYRTGLVPAAFDTRGGEQFLARVAKAAKLSDCFIARPRMDWIKYGPQG